MGFTSCSTLCSSPTCWKTVLANQYASKSLLPPDSTLAWSTEPLRVNVQEYLFWSHHGLTIVLSTLSCSDPAMMFNDLGSALYAGVSDFFGSSLSHAAKPMASTSAAATIF